MTKDFLEFEIPGIITERGNTNAAVVIPLINIDGQTHLLFEQRATSMSEQPGDVCFPGGSVEAGENPLQTAIRECCEELLISPEQLHIVKTLPALSRLGLTMYSFAAEILDYHFTHDEESTEIFTVPLSYFKENEPKSAITQWRVEMGDDFPYDLVYGGKDYKWRKHTEEHYFYQYGSRVIWGYTAKIIHAYIQSL